jgi:hypothetical protein
MVRNGGHFSGVMAKSRRRMKGDDWRRELLDDVTGLALEEAVNSRPGKTNNRVRRRQMTTTLFEENQSFRQPWLWALMLATLAVLLVASLLAPGSQIVPWVVLGLTLAVALLLYSMRLSVQVDAETVRIRFFPVWKKTIPLGDIVRWEARTYRPILEYGGWGIRYMIGRGWAYNVRGNQGVQLELASGKRILIGSQRAEELARAIGEAKGQG